MKKIFEKNRPYRGILLIFLLIFSFNLAADISIGDFYTAEKLYKLCDGKQANEKECISFIKGVRSGMTAQRLFLGLRRLKNKKTKTEKVTMQIGMEPFCLPKHTSDKVIRNTVLSFIKKIGPKKRRATAGFTVLLALNAAYPCKKSDFENLVRKK